MTQRTPFTLESHTDAVILRSADRRLRISFLTDSIVRITFTGNKPFSTKSSRIVVAQTTIACALKEDDTCFILTTTALRLEVARQTGALRLFDSHNKLLMREPETGGKWLTPRTITRNIFDHQSSITETDTIDGAHAIANAFTTVIDREAFEARLEFIFHEDEALFGLGSHEEGYGNLRGRSRELYQQNMKAVVPHLVSTRGYSVLMDCGSLMTFHDDALGSYWWADAVDELDYYLIAGDTYDHILRNYRHLTGPTPLLPRWIFGFLQSKERYVNATEMLEVVREHRRRNIPLDVIVLDWKSWPNGSGWGQKSFDPVRFPNPTAFIDELHSLGAKIMVSIWPIMTGDCANQRELRERQFMLGNQSTYNAFLPEARNIFWQQANRGLFAHGVDAWWCDCTEPFEADWSGAVKPEPHQRLAINTQASRTYLDAAEINLYSLLHSQGIYEGQRNTTNTKRVINLTRSSYAGQHRYSTISWNGDICATWETLRRCIAEGLNFCATGEAYWTVDAGGFFLNNDPTLWFWRGDYPEGCRGLTAMEALEPDPNDTGCTNPGFFELYTRWMQYAAFLPIFRSHGTDAAREIWRFGEPGTPFYDAIAKCIHLRYQLLPYIYALAADVTHRGTAMIRALALAFPDDTRTHPIADQYLFGPSLLICPITQPAATSRSLYLPSDADWFDFHTNHLHTGGQTITAEAPLHRIPILVRAGSIIPMTESMQYTDELHGAPWYFHIYPGADTTFTLYEDAGDTYAYEQGECSRVLLTWHNATSTFTIGSREGTFATLTISRTVHIRLGTITHTLQYTGQTASVTFNLQEEFTSHA
jgi:alpha-D-xyloside xylohydrolase